MPPVTSLVPGAILHGYRIGQLLGEGGMGSVHAAVHLASGTHVALKSMKPAAAANEDFRRRFRREARAAMAVRHPNVVAIHEVFEEEGLPFIAMEYLAGESLEQRLTKFGALPLRSAARILVRVTSAVGTAHAMGIVHRDLKPANVFLVGGGENPLVKVLDFGVAKLTAMDGIAAKTAALTRTGELMGSPFYMSPEQAFGKKAIDQRTDIWSLGIILYRMLSGVLPTRADGFGEVFLMVVHGELRPLRELVPGLPPDVDRLVTSMLQKSPDDRPWDLREAQRILLSHVDSTTPAAVPSFGEAILPETAAAGVDQTVAQVEPTVSMRPTPWADGAATQHYDPPTRVAASVRPAHMGSPFDRPPSVAPPARRSPPVILLGLIAIVVGVVVGLVIRLAGLA
jgi:serine/threonine protein kinase